ncbi:Mu-like prophage FluMu tail sheath protein [Acrasis kona]|uniref:Mu-like prophage FluMu tail sheath protein n=1 Tax=Acrasis kona TaxID=1008807 RepID=A0AAW2ZM61_9EUKA
MMNRSFRMGRAMTQGFRSHQFVGGNAYSILRSTMLGRGSVISASVPTLNNHRITSASALKPLRITNAGASVSGSVDLILLTTDDDDGMV